MKRLIIFLLIALIVSPVISQDKHKRNKTYWKYDHGKDKTTIYLKNGRKIFIDGELSKRDFRRLERKLEKLRDIEISIPEIDLRHLRRELDRLDDSLNDLDFDIEIPEIPEIDIQIPEIEINIPPIPEIDIHVPEFDIQIPEIDIDIPEIHIDIPNIHIPPIPHIDINLDYLEDLEIDLDNLDELDDLYVKINKIKIKTKIDWDKGKVGTRRRVRQ